MMNSIIAQQISFEKDPDKNTTATYEELVSYYEDLVKGRKDAKLIEIGKTDIGKPLQILILSADGDFDPNSAKKKGKTVLFMNNGIHPGEPEGIDASMMFVRDLLNKKSIPNDVVICLIPIYNIAGMLNRGVSRVNQNGPVAYGFRGTEQHYDLNRDFIKGDTRNSKLFQQIFSSWDPDVFFDTHASNGADYQYKMTLIETQKDKLHNGLGDFMRKKFTEPMYIKMKEKNFPMIPYVNSKDEQPESGIVSFLDAPRYSTGYAALHHTIGYMPETHMWKSYDDRVYSTYALMDIVLDLTIKNGKDLQKLRSKIKNEVIEQKEFPILWKLNEKKQEKISFLGFEAGNKISEVSGQDRLYYDRTKPYNKEITYYGTYEPLNI